MSNLDKYLQLKEKVEIAQQKADKAEGALEQLIERLKKEFCCSSVSVAKKKLTALQKQQTTLERDFEKAIEEFEKEWEVQDE